ncbi:MAG TPA: hypothetical protein VN253_25960 [Kofleriaceae bacterium]|nr:hypothetical protein [Kofleriaceae bacterium]
MKRDPTAVLEQLHAAFPAEPISAEGAFADWGATYLDAAAYIEQLEGKSWTDLDRAYFLQRADALGFLGPRHLIAVLPVYLRSLVEDGVWSQAADTLILLLTKPGPEKKKGLKLPRFEALVGALTPAQRTAIATLLSVFAMADESGSLGRAALNALNLYWDAYLPASP